MKKIELTEQEINLIEQHLRDSGYYDQDNETVAIVDRMLSAEDQECMDALQEKAEALQEEIDPEMEGQFSVWNCDILLWYYNLYKAQEAEEAKA